jgi:hypothetical protein
MHRRRRQPESSIYQAPTGSGKTVLFAFIVESAARRLARRGSLKLLFANILKMFPRGDRRLGALANGVGRQPRYIGS